MQIRTVTNALVPTHVDEFEGRKWAHFMYRAGDEPWKWPQLIEIEERLFKWMSFNSDCNTVHYREILPSEIAWIVEDKKVKAR